MKIRPASRSLIFFSIFLLLGVALLVSIPRVSMPLMVAFVLSMVLRPIIPVFQKFGMGTDLSIILTFLGLGVFLLYPIVKFYPSIHEEVEKFQYYIPKVENLVREQYGNIKTNIENKLSIELPELELNSMAVYINSALKTFIFNVPNVVASFLEWLILLPLFLFFLLRDGSSIKRGFLKVVPNAIFERAYYLVSQFSKKIGGYIFAKFIEASIIGVIITLGLLFMDVRFAFILGIVAAVTNIIPYLGPILGLLPGLIVGFIDYGLSPSLGGVVMLYAVANIIDLAFVFPILVSKIVDLHPVIVIVSVIIGSQYFGVVGMVVSIPLTASFKLVAEEIYRDISPRSS